MPHLRSLALLTGTAMLAACSFAPRYVRPTGAVPATLPQGGIYPAAASDAPDVTRVGWRAFFTDPRLRDVIARALDNNRDLRIAAGNVLQARERYRIQRADQLPTVGISAGANATNNSFSGGGGGATSAATTGNGSSGNAGGNGVQPGGGSNVQFYQLNAGVSAFELDLFGRVRNLSRAALEQYLATQEAQRAARISLVAETATAWLQFAADVDQLTLSRRTLTAFASTRELTQAQFRIGVASELEARQADTNYQAAVNDIAVNETRIAQDRNALELLVGAPVEPALLPAGLGTDEATLVFLPAGVPSAVLLQRPDVLQAEHQLIAQDFNIGAARAARFPIISLTATAGTISSALTGLFSGGSFIYSAGPTATTALFEGGRSRANIRLAYADRAVAVSTYERAIQVAFREVADALAQRGTIDRQIGAQTARAQSAEVAARLSDARYRVGVSSFLNTLDAQRTAYAAEQQLVTTRLARGGNLVELYRALGGGLDSGLLSTRVNGVASPP